MEQIWNSLDMTSVKLSAFPLLGIFSGNDLLQWFSCIGIASTIIYNGIRIYNDLKNKNKEK